MSMLPLTVPSRAYRDTTLTVHPSGGAEYEHIQDAIDAARPGDTVYVYSATYYENLIITKSITLMGQNTQTTIIDGANTELNILCHVTADYVTIKGFTLQNSKQTYYSSAIVLNNSKYATITDTVITHCKDGIILWGDSSYNTIYHTSFIDNTNNARDTGYANVWNATYPSGGNYWDDATGYDSFSGPYQNQSGSDGIYDTPYYLSEHYAQDNYPYVDPDGWLNTHPVAEANGPYIGYVNQPVLLDGSNSYDVEGPLTYEWNCGDGTYLNTTSASHAYAYKGTYPVRLTVTDTNGVTETDETIVYIWDAPNGTFTIYPTDDTFVYEKNPKEKYGNLSSLLVSNTSGNDTTGWQRHSYVRFNLSSISPCMEITAASLQLYYYAFERQNPAGRILTLHRLQSIWNENSTTWNYHPINDTTILASATVPDEFGWMTWDVISDVQQTIVEQEYHEGWQITDEHAWGHVDIPIITFKSKETCTMYSPCLTLDYTLHVVVSTTGPYQGTVDDDITIEPKIIGYGIPPYIWTWQFGDDTISYEQTPTHHYTTAGQYTITVTVEDANGEQATAKTTATIHNTTSSILSAYIDIPAKGLYLGKWKLCPLFRPWVVGPLTVTVALLHHENPVTSIDFYIDGEYKDTITTEPYQWTWRHHSGFGRHTITAVIHDSLGTEATCSLDIWKLL